MSNKIKILNVLEKEKGLISTTELANKTGINLGNITRYLKPLEQEGIIVRKTIQNGKIRVVNVGMNTEKPIEKAHPPIAPKREEIKKEQLHPPKPIKIMVGEKSMIEKMDSLESKLTSLDSKLNAILGLDLPVIKDALHRANSTIKNKLQVERKEGKYYQDHVLWTHEIEKIEKIEQGSTSAYKEVMKELKGKLASKIIT